CKGLTPRPTQREGSFQTMYTKSSREQYEKLSTMHKNMQKLYENMGSFYAFDPHTLSVEDFFGELTNFHGVTAPSVNATASSRSPCNLLLAAFVVSAAAVAAFHASIGPEVSPGLKESPEAEFKLYFRYLRQNYAVAFTGKRRRDALKRALRSSSCCSRYEHGAGATPCQGFDGHRSRVTAVPVKQRQCGAGAK
ncbi:hypothetical protein NHX12_011244, partial [Muraenolepis orangiensis]